MAARLLLGATGLLLLPGCFGSGHPGPGHHQPRDAALDLVLAERPSPQPPSPADGAGEKADGPDGDGDGGDGSDDAGRDGADDGADDGGPDGGGDGSRGVPAFGRVWLIIMENHGPGSIEGNAAAPFINGLQMRWASASEHHFVTHPSLPNYVALTSGGTQGITCNCPPVGAAPCGITCDSACACARAVPHLGLQLDVAGLSWRQYAEGMGTACGTLDVAAAHFAVRHVPFVYYDDVRGDAARCADRVRDFSDFGADLAAGGRRVSFITPDLCHAMHDGCGGDAVAHGDAWLGTVVPFILASPSFLSDGVLFIVWDEDSGGAGPGTVPLIIVSPLVRPGARTAVVTDHYGLLATIEDGLGMPRLGLAAAASPVSDIWK